MASNRKGPPPGQIVTAVSRKLKARWSVEMQEDLRVFSPPPWLKITMNSNGPDKNEHNKKFEGHECLVGQLYTFYTPDTQIDKFNLWPENPQEQEARFQAQRSYDTARGIPQGHPKINPVPIDIGTVMLCVEVWPDIKNPDFREKSPGSGPMVPEFLVNDQSLTCMWYKGNEHGYIVPLDYYRKNIQNGKATG